MVRNLVVILVIFGVLLPSFAFFQEQPVSPPETLEEAREIGERALEVSKKELPGILEKIWKEEVLPIWQKMYDWFKTNIWPKIEFFFKKEVEPRAKGEIEKRKPIIKEEFKKEKEELKKEVKEEVFPKAFKSLWEKFKELIK